ncbi:dUTP diphosphatase [Priestia filamentosa]|uniref:dUTP diphosphatase n=1 Tax=Priestia filamentosa TaxID=1402861 RepID=UPI001FB3E694|nr:dUTP diphosphatase [Priestia filamentosa]MED3725569.1 dUTP diphosphatase [Priestia filamentosa]UOE61187.1 dUTP diphosphatase [Priestia filamentosa]
MNFTQLFSMQHELDTHIEQKHGLQEESLIQRKTLALLVELGELANETRCFKFWSLKKPAEREVILEEYVDGIHFILSLGLEINIDQEKDFKKEENDNNINEQFLYAYQTISAFQVNQEEQHYEAMFSSYLQLGYLLGFSAEDIKRAYLEKNEENFKRQEQGY